jgi:prenyltransferase beta subunit
MYIPIYLRPYSWYQYPNYKSDSLVEFIISCCNEDGGIGNYTDSVSYLETVFYAITSLSLLDKMHAMARGIVDYILGKEAKNGGFGETSKSANLFNTFYSTIALKIMSAITPAIRKRTVSYLVETQVKTCFVSHHVGVCNITSLYWFTNTAKCLAFDISDHKDFIVSFVKECYVAEVNLFAAIPNGIATLQNTYEALTILRELSALDIVDIDALHIAIFARKNRSLYTDEMLQDVTLSSTMWAIGSLSIINRIEILEQADTLSSAVTILGNTNTLYEKFCCLTIIANITYNIGQIKYKNTLLLTEVDDMNLLNTLSAEEIRIQKLGYDKSQFDLTEVLPSTSLTISRDSIFVQILLQEQCNHLFELEKLGDRPLALEFPFSRVNKECISPRIINTKKLRVLGVLKCDDVLHNDSSEAKVLESFFKNSSVFKYRALKGHDASKTNVEREIENGVDIFYFSGHSDGESLYVYSDAIRLDSIFIQLEDNGCSLAILNCCNTYRFVKHYYIDRNQAVSESMNVVSAILGVVDYQAALFMTYFLHYLELSFPISEALRLTKNDMWLNFNGLGDTWYNYILFGNPYTILA